MKYPTPADEMMKQFVVMVSSFSKETALIIFPESRPDYWNCHPTAIFKLTEKDAIKLS